MKCLLYSFITLLLINFICAQTEPNEPEVTTVDNSTTTEPPIPTPELGYWNVTDVENEEITCIRIELKLRFKLYPKGNDTKYFVLKPAANTNGSTCQGNDGSQVLELNTRNITLTFVFVTDEFKHVYVKTITITRKDEPDTFTITGSFFNAKSGNSYLCNTLLEQKVDRAILEILHIQVQAFAGTEHYFGTPEECAQDDVVNEVVPIAVAIALAALIVLVLVAYLIGRRRSRQKGYNDI